MAEEPPLFSVILPTKGRPELTRIAVESVLAQDFPDFRMILVDNDDGDETLDALAELVDHPRLVYKRTGGLSMVDNWNAALDCFDGSYLLWMDSKSFFYPGAFRELAGFLKEQNQPDVVCWGYDFVFDSGKKTKFVGAKPNASLKTPSRDILEDFLNYRIDRAVWSKLPRGVCTALSAKVLSDIRGSFDGKIFSTVSPDIILTLKVLSVTPDVSYFPAPLTCVSSSSVSHGRNFAARKADLNYFLKPGSSQIEEPMIVPLKNTKIAANWVANDIEKTLQRETAVWQSHKTGYSRSLAREVGSTIGRVGFVYSWRELRELVAFWGFDPRIYYILINRIVRCVLVTNFDALPGLRFKEMLKKLALKISERDIDNVVEVDANAAAISRNLIANGRDWIANER